MGQINRVIPYNGYRINEKVTFLNSGSGNLFFNLYMPPANNLKKIVLMLPPLWVEQDRALSIMAKIGLHLALNGYTAVKFDYTGTGNSDGENTDISLKSIENDIRFACNWLSENFPDFDLKLVIGFHIGSNFGLYFNKQLSGFSQFVYIHPLISVSNYIKRSHILKYLLNKAITSKESVSYDTFVTNLNLSGTMELESEVFKTGFIKDLLGFPDITTIPVDDPNNLFIFHDEDPIKDCSNIDACRTVKFSRLMTWEDEKLYAEKQFILNIKGLIINFLKNNQ
jgi:alpha/beta superfamily hydrolase